MSISSVAGVDLATLAQQPQNQNPAGTQAGTATQADSAEQAGKTHHHHHHGGGGGAPPPAAATTQPGSSSPNGSTGLNTVA